MVSPSTTRVTVNSAVLSVKTGGGTMMGGDAGVGGGLGVNVLGGGAGVLPVLWQ